MIPRSLRPVRSSSRSPLRAPALAPPWAALVGICLGLAPSPAHATEPVAKIVGKTTVPQGQSVILLDGRASIADPPNALTWEWRGSGTKPFYQVMIDQESMRPVVLLLYDPAPGTYKFKLVAVGKKSDGTPTADADVIEFAVLGPTPVPTPTPTPTPVPPTPGPIPPTPTPTPGPPTPGPTPPTPSPAPIPAPGLHVLMVYESGELSKLPPAQLSVLYAKSIRDYLQAKCPVGPDGKTKEWRIWDKDTDASGDAPVWRDAMKRPRTSVPWIIVSNGTSGYEGPLPASIDEALKLLRQFGGD